MIEVYGDFWQSDIPIKCITTNGDINSKHFAVMGRGIALDATRFMPGIAATLADKLNQGGNHVHYLTTQAGYRYVSFPVKHHWFQQADLNLIKRSAWELVALADDKAWQYVLLPRPGCGNGGLLWRDVKPVIAPILDERFHVITKIGGL